MVNSFNTKSIIFKIKSNYDFDYLNIKMNVGGEAFIINLDSTEKIIDIFFKFSFFFIFLLKD